MYPDSISLQNVLFCFRSLVHVFWRARLGTIDMYDGKQSKRNKGSHRWYFVVYAIGFSQIIFLLSISAYRRRQQLSPIHPSNHEFRHPATTKDDYTVQQQNSNFRNKTTKISFSHVVTARNFDVVKLSHPNPFDKKHHQEKFDRPLLTELVPNPKNNTILQDVDFLLDFAIIGFAKVCEEFVLS
jgi:hypothetical protein